MSQKQQEAIKRSQQLLHSLRALLECLEDTHPNQALTASLFLLDELKVELGKLEPKP